MSGRDASTCRSCGAPVVWRRHAKTGKWAPIDATPAAEGNVVMLARSDRYAIVPRGELGQDDARPRYTPHFATCPHAAAHRAREGTA